MENQTELPDLFTRTLRNLRSGQVIFELSQQLQECVQESQETNKMSEITLKLKIKPGKGASGQFFIEDTITQKLPKHDKSDSIFFGTPEGNLVRDDPRQMSIFEQNGRDITRVNPETGEFLKI